jgi:hypothetical protein
MSSINDSNLNILSSTNNPHSSNGRVNIMRTCAEPKTKDLFAMYDKIPTQQCASLREATLGIWDPTQLSELFFSEKNINIIQNGIRAGVYRKSNGQYIIGQQDCDSLKIIMRSIFLQFSANQETYITDQIRELNDLVLKYTVYQVYGEAQGYIKYLYDASNMYTPMAPPIMSSTSDKQLFLKSFF